MKKLWLAFFVLVIAVITSVYILIPNTIKISEVVYADVKSTSILRALHNDTKWEQWFPGKTAGNSFTYNGQQYKPGKKEYASLVVSMSAGNISYNSAINVIEINPDSSILQWEMQLPSSNNPFERVKQYQSAKKIKDNMDVVLNSFKTFIQQPQNIYGFNIQRTTLTDTALVSIKTITKEYPSTQLIYSLVEQLKKYIQQQNATEHNYPMLNVTQLKDSSYDVMVGIPTNIPLQGNDFIKPKRMIMLKNKTLVTDVKGDNNMIKKAFNATGNYMSDNGLSSPVIPFQQLITNRSIEKDSTKWITKIFTPVS